MEMSVIFEVCFNYSVPFDDAFSRLHILNGHLQLDHVTRHPIAISQPADVLIFQFEVS